MSNESIAESLSSRLAKLSRLQLDEVDRLVKELEILNQDLRPTLCRPNFDWPHAPVHRLDDCGVYIVTGSTENKKLLFNTEPKLDLLQSTLLRLSQESCWQVEAWACFANHYHFIARATESAGSLKQMVQQLHAETADGLNAMDRVSSRNVWFNFYDTQLTYHNSYMARLNYVHQNPVKHRLVQVANRYPWCSAAWFERTATPAQVKTVYSFKTDHIKVIDDFDEWPDGYL